MGEGGRSKAASSPSSSSSSTSSPSSSSFSSTATSTPSTLLTQPLIIPIKDDNSIHGTGAAATASASVRKPALAMSMWPTFLPSVLFYFSLFGIQPILSQFIIQLECDRMGASDCNSPEVSGASVLTIKYLYTLEFASATLTVGTLGAMSDYWGRKKAVILTSCGALFNICLLLLALTFSASSSSFSTATTPGVPSSPSSYRAALICLYVGTIVNGLSGSYGVYLTGIYAYAADITKRAPADRGVLFAKIVGSIAVGNTLGPLVSGLLLKSHGFYLPLLVNALLCLVTITLLGWRVKESLDPEDKPQEPFRPFRQHNTFVVLYQFLFTRQHGHTSHQREGGREGGREGKVKVPPLFWLSACFCLAFSDLVGQGTIFIYYGKRVFHWKPDTLG
ncbi:hypothetical protein VYU27_008375, partial [Nannochloropsis oceanica]